MLSIPWTVRISKEQVLRRLHGTATGEKKWNRKEETIMD